MLAALLHTCGYRVLGAVLGVALLLNLPLIVAALIVGGARHAQR